MFRPGLLTGIRVALAGDMPGVGDRLAGLGAELARVPDPAPPQEAPTQSSVAGLGRVDALVVGTAGWFTDAGGGLAGLHAAVEAAWTVVRAVVSAGWLPEDGAAPGGRVLLLAPPPAAGPHAPAAAAALENLVRTLGTEWARRQITTVCVLPEDATPPDAVADLVAFLASPGGAYLSGTALRLG